MSYLEKYPWNTLAAFLLRVCSQKWKWSTWISSSFVADQKDSKHCGSSKIFQNSNFLDNFSSPIFLCVLIWKKAWNFVMNERQALLLLFSEKKGGKICTTSLAYTFNQRGSKHDPVSKYNIELWISTQKQWLCSFLWISLHRRLLLVGSYMLKKIGLLEMFVQAYISFCEWNTLWNSA